MNAKFLFPLLLLMIGLSLGIPHATGGDIGGLPFLLLVQVPYICLLGAVMMIQIAKFFKKKCSEKQNLKKELLWHATVALIGLILLFNANSHFKSYVAYFLYWGVIGGMVFCRREDYGV